MIKKLSDCYAPSGKEGEVREAIISELNDFYTDIKIDNLGNLIIHKAGKGKAIAITAPMDETGFIVTHHNSPDFVATSSIGTVKPKTLHNIMLSDNSGNCYINTQNDEINDNNGKVNSYKLDILSRCKGDSLNNNLISNTLIFSNNFTQNEDYIVGKALERSVSCKILCDLAREVRDSLFEYYFVFSAQNYCDKKGAQVALNCVNIDELYNICVIEDEEAKLGEGPVVILRDKNYIADSKITHKLDKYNKIQRLVTDKLICEAGFWQRNSSISSVLAIGIPVKNLYTPNEFVRCSDITVLTKILKEIVLP